MNPETPIQSRIHLALGSRPDTRVFRNSVGVVQSVDGRYVRYGLTPGSADLVGWHSLTITPEMVGRRIAVFLSVEVKTPRGRPSPEQTNWLNAVRAAGGIACIARSPAEALDALRIFSQQPEL